MSNEIYELFGHTLDDDSAKARNHRLNCQCPFTGTDCDGGGNRYQTFLNRQTVNKENLTNYFSNKLALVPPGICSLKTKDAVWIVCPRRVFSIAGIEGSTHHKDQVAKILNSYCNLLKNRKIGIWAEVKVKYSETEEDDNPEKSFDYTFDYLVSSLGEKKLQDISTETGISEQVLRKTLAEAGYTLSMKANKYYMEEYPVGPLNIIEVMTSSTSGGNKTKGTTIQQAFIKAVKGKRHASPGINYRQVWARMVSQLIVKSQIGKAWGSKTVWVLQDSLTNYISKSTDLNLAKLISEYAKEINILSLKYTNERDKSNCLKLTIDKLFAGAIPKIESDIDFHKLLHASSIPDMALVKNRLILKPLKGIL